MSSAWQVLRYHEETKHHLHGYARSPGYLDWETQPDPFRRWNGVHRVLLPFLDGDPEGRHADLYARSRNIFWDFTLESVAAFLELSMGLSAWKSTGHARWALRMNPSSGNLHPTECHLVLPPLTRRSALRRLAQNHPSPLPSPLKGEGEEEGGVFHYHPHAHALEMRARLPAGYVARLQSHFQSPGFLVGLTSIPWREAWKYGERAWRYCQHDAGHALAALSFAGNLLGWKVTWLNAISDEEGGRVLGLDRARWPEDEEEEFDLLCRVSPAGGAGGSRELPLDLVTAMASLEFQGTPSGLSPAHVTWSLISETSAAARKPRTPETSVRFSDVSLSATESPLSAAALIRDRRSAVAFDGKTGMTREAFFSVLKRTLPLNAHAPFDVEVGPARVHLAVFVHRVEGLTPGLYFFLRRAEDLADLKRSLDRTFVWTAVPGAEALYLLKEGDFRSIAERISCHQSIAGRSAFSLGMLSQFSSLVEKEPWTYRLLFWEAGMIGQCLYLEVQAQGLRGTGIGCFFDEEMHHLLGLRTRAWQSLYHFTVGGPIKDIRLSTEPPYAHLPADRR